MIFHENRLLADHSHEILFLIFSENLEKRLHNLSSAAVVIGALRVKRPNDKNAHFLPKFQQRYHNCFHFCSFDWHVYC